MKYKHIFDYFDYDGKWIGGAEPITNSKEQPKVIHDPSFNKAPTYIIYIGWCKEDEPIFSNWYPKDVVTLDKKTHRLTRKYKKIVVCNTITHLYYIDSQLPKSEITGIEYCCEFIGQPLPKKYIEYKELQNKIFEAEYQQVCSNKEYFKKAYYKQI